MDDLDPKRSFTTARLRRMELAAAVYLDDCYLRKTAVRTSEFAQVLDVTPQYISWIAPMILGMPLQDYLRDKQLDRAAQLLTLTPLSVEEIAMWSGFGTPATFYRWFIARFNVHPSTFRLLKK